MVRSAPREYDLSLSSSPGVSSTLNHSVLVISWVCRGYHIVYHASRSMNDSTTVKTCSICKVNKPIDFFHRSNRVKCGRRAACAECVNARAKDKNRKITVIHSKKECTKCKLTKPLDDFYSSHRARDGRVSRCKSCLSIQGKKRKFGIKYCVPDEKRCAKCGQVKRIDKFHRDCYQKDGYSSTCKQCIKLKDQKRATTTIKYCSITKKCKKCNCELLARSFAKRSTSKDGLEATCRECKKKYKDLNKERIAELNRAWYERNREDQLEKAKTRRKDNRASRNFYNATRHAIKLRASPPWLTADHKRQIKSMYKLSEKLTQETGIRYNVDHIHPLQCKDCCGLHVPWNLTVITARENSRKRNKLIPELGLTG